MLIEDPRGPSERSIGDYTGLGGGYRHERRLRGTPQFLPPPQPGKFIPRGEAMLRCPTCGKPYRYMDLLRMEIGTELAGHAS